MLRTLPTWRTAETATYIHIAVQLAHCQAASTTGMFCDLAGIGKTHAAREYAATHAGAVYIDCSQHKTKHQFIRAIATAFGIESAGRLADVRHALIRSLEKMPAPLVILDEAGDLDYPAFLEIKSLYNATEHICGWYMMGAEGLRAKMERLRISQKVGYAEIFDRLGARYQAITDDLSDAERAMLMRAQTEAVLTANLPRIPAAQRADILTTAGHNLRRLRKEIVKHQTAAAA